MSQKIVNFTLAADLVGGGTVAVSYPAGTSKGNFSGSLKHKLATSAGNVFGSPAYFTLTFGATTVTINWTSGSPTIPAGTVVLLQLDQPGYSAAVSKSPLTPMPAGMTRVGAFSINLGSPGTASSNGYATSQSVAQNASAVLNGSLVSNGVGVADAAYGRNIVAAWTTAAILTFTFKDFYGNTVVEKSASGTSHTGSKACMRLISVSSDTAITGLTVGTGTKLGLPVYIPFSAAVLAELENGFKLNPPERVSLTGQINQTDLLAPTTQDIVSPFAGYIARLRTMVQVAITTGGTIKAQVNTADVTGCSVTIANSATKGTAGAATPTTARSATTVVAKGDRISIVPASFASAGAVNYELEIETNNMTGTLATGSTAKPTATTGDVRGTYDPATAPDGTTAYELIVQLEDPDFYGQDQYAG